LIGGALLLSLLRLVGADFVMDRLGSIDPLPAGSAATLLLLATGAALGAALVAARVLAQPTR